MKPFATRPWSRLKAMPGTLRAVTLGLWILGIIGIISPFIPGWSDETGSPIPLRELWSEGSGLAILALGLCLLLLGTLIYRGPSWGRHALMFAVLALGVSVFFSQEYKEVPIGILVAIAVLTVFVGVRYLYLQPEVIAWFTRGSPPSPALPALLKQMLEDGSWQHPGDEVISRLIPFVREPLDFLTSFDQIATTPSQSVVMGPREAENELGHEYRGSRTSARDLPWRDVEKSLLIAINRIPGDDVAIALDYRTSTENPRVIASEWVGPGGGTHCCWREVAPTFTEFRAKLLTASKSAKQNDDNHL